MPYPPEVAVLIVSFNGREHLRDCLESVLASDDGILIKYVAVVDNASDDASADLVEQEFPQVGLVRCSRNLGFAGGNNAGWDHIRTKYPQVDYVALLNQDTIVESGWLEPLVEHLEGQPTVGVAQPKLLLHPQTDRINTFGNQSHFLGFGFITGYGRVDNGEFQSVSAIDFPSGAAFMVRSDILHRFGLFDELFFLYLEDADLGWKLRQMGYDVEVVPGSRVWHKYEFGKNFRHYYYLERNRWYLLATYYKTATLLLLMPALLLMEAGQIYFACRNHLLGQKLRAVGFFLNIRNLGRLLRQRRQAQRRRIIRDRDFTAPFTGNVDFSELNSVLLKRVGNPILSTYWRFARKVMFW
jgi:GT2 family glycosyltransferase